MLCFPPPCFCSRIAFLQGRKLFLFPLTSLIYNNNICTNILTLRILIRSCFKNCIWIHLIFTSVGAGHHFNSHCTDKKQSTGTNWLLKVTGTVLVGETYICYEWGITRRRLVTMLLASGAPVSLLWL
jgi:hypothetical protein